MKMKMLVAIAGLMSLAAAGVATPALATTVDFTGAGVLIYDPVSQNYGDSAEADLSYQTLTGGNNWGQSATQLFPDGDHVDYWAQTNYSQDNAIFAIANGNKLELGLQAGSGLAFTSIAFNLGSYPDVNRVIAFKLYDANWNLLLSNDTLAVNGPTGALVSLAVNTSALYFQMGDDWDVGIQSLTFQTAAATTPIPAALPLFASALGVLGFAARRRKQAQA